MAGMLHRSGEPLAFVGGTRYFLAPSVRRLPVRDRDRRAIEGVCVALLQRGQDGPFFLAEPPRR